MTGNVPDAEQNIPYGKRFRSPASRK